MSGMLGDVLLVNKMEQRIRIKFCYENGIWCSVVSEMLNAFGGRSVNETSVYKWHNRYQEGVEDDERPGGPDRSTTDDNVKPVKIERGADISVL